MADVSEMIGTMKSSMQKLNDKISTSHKAANNIKQSWQGTDEEAFSDAYKKLKKELTSSQEIYGKFSSKLASLQSSMKAADQDKERKKKEKNK